MDRKIAPQIKAIKKVIFPKVMSQTLENGIPLHIIPSTDSEVVKLELVFKAGRSRELEPLTAKATSSLLKEGTQNYNSEQLAEKIDFYGSSIVSTSGMDVNSITLYCIKKYFGESLELLEEILFRPSFPEEELQKYQTRAAERLHQELSKNSVVAYRKLTEVIFGKDHYYGYNSYPESYKEINREDILFHYHHAYTSQNCKIYLSGYVDDRVIAAVNENLGKEFGTKPLKEKKLIVPNQSPQQFLIPGNKLQNSIKIGKRLFNRQDPDYHNFFMLNTILGGYFGARLMSSIREEKGYTYNIYSSLDPMEFDGYFFVSTEVGTEYHQKTLDAIAEEMHLLQQEKVNDRELQMAKNYVLGNFLSMLDGPLKSSKVLKMLLESDLGIAGFDKMVSDIAEISSDTILSTADKHLNFNDLHQVSVGDVTTQPD